MKYKTLIGFLFLYTCQCIASSAQQPIAQGLVARWCFETGLSPTDDTAPFGKVKDKLTVNGGVNFENGIAKLKRSQSAGLVASFSEDLVMAKEMSVWARIFIPVAQQNQTLGQKNVIVDQGTFTMYYQVKNNEKGETLFGIGAQANGNEGVSTNPAPQLNVQVGIWLQALTVVGTNGSGKREAKVYYRAELPNKNLNNWVYVGKFPLANTSTKQPFVIGNNQALSQQAEDFWVDEVKIYNRAIAYNDIAALWPITKNFTAVPAKPFGVVIDYVAAKTGRFMAGSPSIVVLQDGTYIAKGDDYGPAVGISELVRVYRSKDKGNTWQQISELEGLTWASLFLHKGALYMMGTSAGHGLGHAVIVKSTDGGVNWTVPTNATNGMIFSDLSYHTAPVPVVVHNGRIWRAMEDEKGKGGWGTNFRAFLLSAPVDADLLVAANWTMSNTVAHNPAWLGGEFKGVLEGNAVVSPKGNLVNVLRVSKATGGAKAAIISYSEDGKVSTFDPEKDFIDFPGGSTKFHILYDAQSKHYWTLSNAVMEKHDSPLYGQSLIRNSLVVMSSPDLRNWTVRDTLLYHPDIAQHGFQYPTFVFDGEDMIYVSRTAFDDGVGGAYRQHDANYFTFHRIKSFRKLLKP
jgi:hypothetical protein